MALTCDIKGVIPIAPTPFQEDGRIDDSSLDRMTDFFLACGIDGITILGQLGEAAKLDAQESTAIAKRIIKRASVPVVVGVTAAGFAGMRSLSREVMELGAAGVMIAPPNTLRTDDQIVMYLPRSRGSNRHRRALRHPGLPAYVLGGSGVSPLLDLSTDP